jgi:hypothetical protein
MNTRVLLMTLSERTSARGTSYMSGFLGKARVVAFKASEPDKFGNDQWELYVSEPKGEADQGQPSPRTDHGRDRAGKYDQPPQQRRDQRRAQSAGEATVAMLRQGRGTEPLDVEPIPPGGDPIPW